MRKSCHIYNIDNLLIDIEQKVWIVSKKNPSRPLIKIDKHVYDMIYSDVYKSANNIFEIGGTDRYFPDELVGYMGKLIDKELMFSFREFLDKDTIDGLKYTFDIEPMEFLKNSTDHVFFLASKKTERAYSRLITELKDTIEKNLGVVVKKTYYINESYFAQDKDLNIKYISNIILSNLIGKKIENGETTDDIDAYYKVNYYDTSSVIINKLRYNITKFKDELKIDPKFYFRKFIILNKVTSNILNPIVPTEVNLHNNVIKFENYKSKF